jgi:hypothetical protein
MGAMIPRRQRRLATLCFLLLQPLALAQQRFATPSDVRLEIQTQNQQKSFYIGQIIPIELRFSSATPATYQLDMASYDRSGRRSIEEFKVAPSTGWVDPIAAYMGGIGGGLRGLRMLSAEPTKIELQLNEWIRFDKAGQYRVQIVSHRASNVRTSVPYPGLPVEVISNELEITIAEPPSEWQDDTLRQAVEILDNARTPIQSGQSKEWEGVKTLRYLGTPAAAREMARRIRGEPWDNEFRLGLLGSSARSAVIDETERLLVEPEFPVTGSFMWIANTLAADLNGVRGDRVRRAEIEAQYWDRLGDALKTKRGLAQTVSASTLLDHSIASSRNLSPDTKSELTLIVTANFDALPLRAQWGLLEYQWSALDHTTLLPLLERVARRYRDFPMLRSGDAMDFNRISAAAFKRWYELAPERARAAALEEMARPKPRFGVEELALLGDDPLPSVERLLVEHLEQLEDFEDFDAANIAALIQRYATRSVKSEVARILDRNPGKWPCTIQVPLFAYLLKVEPAAARSRLELAMAARGPGFSACNASLLPEVGKLWNDPLLQEMAVKSLDDPDPQVVASAAAYLQKLGTASAEDALWDRFSRWSAQWRDRADELRYMPGAADLSNVYQSGAGQNMLSALAEGHAWLVDRTKLLRLIELSVGPEQRRRAEEYLRRWEERPWTITFAPEDPPRIGIVYYSELSIESAKIKLSQFPAGTRLQWLRQGRRSEQEERALKELSAFASSLGIVIEPTPLR